MSSTHRFSFRVLLALIFLIPIFFIPSTLIPLGVAKTIILSLGVVIALVALLIEVLRSGGISIPRTHLMWGVLLLPLAYLLSALASATPALSLYGYSFETGTFAFILIASVLFGLTAIVVTDAERVLRVYAALFLSLVLLVIFAFVKIVTHGSAFVFGNFDGTTGNPIGAWTDFAVGFGLLAVLSLFAIEMLQMKKLLRITLYVVAVLATLLIAILNFSTAWYMTLGASLIALVYFFTVERVSVGSWKLTRLVPVTLLFIVALIFSINPVISNKTVGTAVSDAFSVSTSDVRPSFPSTMTVVKQVLAKDALLGTGPNTFDQDWLLYKPAAINTTTFWGIAFPFGVGFLPTAIATTGVLGSLVWLAFIVLFLILGAKSLTRISQSSERFAIISSFVGALFLWAGAILYVPSAAILTLAFIFTGLFVAAARAGGIIVAKPIIFRTSPARNFASVLIVLVLGIGSLAFALTAYQKTASIVHFERALALSRTTGSSADTVEAELNSAIALSPADLYYGSLSELSFARAQGVLQNSTSTPDETQTRFQAVFQKSISAADEATKINPGSYQNWVRLGNVYAALVPAPLSVAGAYESAKGAYETAERLSPENPEPYLLLARLEIDHSNPTAARTDIQTAVTKKQDYVDAYYLLTQLDVTQNNVPEAIQAAQATAILSPDNAGIFFELGLLQYTTGDYANAAQALTRAIQIVPEYANAKYFLGLTLDKLGHHDEAITQFMDLAKSNPDNADVALILANLEAGHDPFYKAPVDQKKPEKRSSPPIPGTSTQE